MKHSVLKLFVLVRNGGAVVLNDDGSPLYFRNRIIAKRVRGDCFPGATIGYGPDHWKYEGEAT